LIHDKYEVGLLAAFYNARSTEKVAMHHTPSVIQPLLWDECSIGLFWVKTYVLLECLNVWVSVISTQLMCMLSGANPEF